VVSYYHQLLKEVSALWTWSVTYATQLLPPRQLFSFLIKESHWTIIQKKTVSQTCALSTGRQTPLPLFYIQEQQGCSKEQQK
jgi:hypothetical protein